MKKFIVGPLLMSLLFTRASAQDPVQKFIEGFKVSKSFTTKDDAAEAATLSITSPKDSAASYLIDLAIKHSLFGNFSVTAELHRNTVVASQQRNYSFGLTGSLGTNPDYLTTSSHTGWITLNGQYSRDQIANTGSVVVDFNYTYLFAGGMLKNKSDWLPNHANQLGANFAMEYDPSIGLQYQNTLDAPKDSLKGNVLRPYFIFNFLLYPFINTFKSNFTLFSNLTYRYDLIKTVKDNDSRSHPLWSYGTEYLVWKALNSNRTVTKTVKLSFSYNTGDDPAQGLKKQQYWLLALKLKL